MEKCILFAFSGKQNKLVVSRLQISFTLLLFSLENHCFPRMHLNYLYNKFSDQMISKTNVFKLQINYQKCEVDFQNYVLKSLDIHSNYRKSQKRKKLESIKMEKNIFYLIYKISYILMKREAKIRIISDFSSEIMQAGRVE